MTHNDVTIISRVLAVTHEKLSACYGAIQIRVNRIYKPCTWNNCRGSFGGGTMDEKIWLGVLCSSPILQLGQHGRNSSSIWAEWPWGPPSLYNLYWGYLVGVKWPCHGIDHPSSSNVRIEKVRHTSSSPLWLHWHVMAWYLTLNSVLRQFTSFWTAHVHMCNVF